MDRLTWYQPGESLEDLLCQAGHVGIYEGDLKHTSFEQGTASLTLHRIIWADSTDPKVWRGLNNFSRTMASTVSVVACIFYYM
ncbi:hypothetical protein ANCCAN_24510 [Ancylostoma caninum]|uniref:Vacuolar protein-sorting-associated protein 36 n=1 Tax=Ancylostoma caninum TaxID=29170 RepID=A0A368FFS5_ANCCA|nr:hypothetical protein ANCCAN_24510 [Ancylostoma caninum]